MPAPRSPHRAARASRPVPAPRRGGARRLLAGLLAVGALAACQPVEEPLPDPAEEPAPDAEGEAVLGAPDDEMPADLGELRERTAPEAERWQPDPRPVEVTVALAGGEWRAASVTYAAAGADSVLVVRVDGEGVATERVNFEPLGLQPLPTEAVADLPPLEGLAAPTDLAAAAESSFPDCDAEQPADEVRLATGAPASWEGEGWAQPPRWEAVVTDGAGLGVRLDAERAEPVGGDRCVEALRG